MSPPILVAPTAFKGTLSPTMVARAIQDGLEGFAVDLLPLADGGDGTIDALHTATGGDLRQQVVTGAIQEERTACWLKLGSTAVVELASACGIAGLEQLHPLTACTSGLGELLGSVFSESGIEEIVIAVGGSASTDGGSGALQALGARFLDDEGKRVLVRGGGSLAQVRHCELDALETRWKPRSYKIKVACDVTNPLLGESGAARVFGPQKGASSQDVAVLSANLASFADVLERATGISARNLPGSGAAGGTAFGLACGLGAEIIQGFDWMAGLVNLDMRARSSSLVVTGEGRLDRTSRHGKLVHRLCQLCSSADIPIWIVTASAEQADGQLPDGCRAEIIVPDRSSDIVTTDDITSAIRRRMDNWTGRTHATT